MLSKSIARATSLALAVFLASCTRYLPWRNEPVGTEVNMSFVLEQNLVTLHTVRLDNRPARFIFGSATPRTVIDSRFAAQLPASRHALQFSEKETVRIDPLPMNLGGAADGIIGVDSFRNYAVSIDYRSGLVTLQKEGIKPGLMEIYRYAAEPTVTVTVDGREMAAVVDTSNPDTLVLPSTREGRGTAHVIVATTDFGTVDVAYANVARPRIGNRLLSRFLVTIDYGRKVVGLWRDPRIPLAGP